MSYNKATQVSIATVAVFIGSLLANVLFGDGIALDDVIQAIFVAGIAAVVQWTLVARQ